MGRNNANCMELKSIPALVFAAKLGVFKEKISLFPFDSVKNRIFAHSKAIVS